MKYGKYTENVFSTGPRTRTGYEAWDGDKLKGTVEVRDAHWAGRTEYPTHPAMRPSRDAAFGRFDGVISDLPSAMNGVRGRQADGNYRMESYDQDWAAQTAAPGQTIPLFRHQSKHHPSKVEYMRTTKGARITAGPLLGIAARDQMARGNELVPDNDLSEHSSPMVRKINGALGTQFSTTKSNTLDFMPGLFGDTLGAPRAEMEGITEIDQAEVGRGKQLMRNVLRNRRAVPDHGFSQTPLFDG